jgi:catechol 2,3-dioxygenase-like lactoylglutathione lyase family enzyme
MSDTALTAGLDHLGLTVRNLAQTREFFKDCLGWKVVRENPDYPMAIVTDGQIVLTLWQAKTEPLVEFNRKSNVGLHHLALKVKDEATFNLVFERASEWPGVRVEFSPEPLGTGPKRHTMLYEPGGIRLEFDYDTSRQA